MREIADLDRWLAELEDRSRQVRMAGGETATAQATLLDRRTIALDAYAHARLAALSTLVLLEDESLRAQAHAVIEAAARAADACLLRVPAAARRAAPAAPVDDAMAAALAALTDALLRAAR